MKKLLIIILTICLLLSISIKASAIGTTYSEEGLTIELGENHQYGGHVSLTGYGSNAVNASGYDEYDDYLGWFNCFYFALFVNVSQRFSQVNNALYVLAPSEAAEFFKYGGHVNDGVYSVTDRWHADLVAYYDDEDKLIHLGKVIDVYEGTSNGVLGDLDLVKVLSKWGTGQIVEHRGDCCPEMTSGETEYVLYYKYTRNHTCSYGHSYVDINNHRYKCLVGNVYCGYGLTNEPHIIVYAKKDVSNHYKNCDLCSFSVQEAHTWLQISDSLFTCIHCNQRALYIENYHDAIIFDHKSMYGIINYNGKNYTVILID